MKNIVNDEKYYITIFKQYYEEFLKHSINPRVIQEEKLFDILRKNKNSTFGKKHEFAEIKTVEEYRKNVPISGYEEYIPYIKKISSKNKILTSEKVILFEPTSGSTSDAKLIPYTAGLKKEFLAGIGPWLYSISLYYPKSLTGKQYWSITPVIGNKKATSKSGIEIGFEDDSKYLSNNKNKSSIQFVVPPEIKQVSDQKSFRYLTQLFLIKEKRLSLISIWNPSMMQVLFQDIKENMPKLCKDIEGGALNKDLLLSSKLRQKISKKLNANPRRAKELLNIYNEKKDNEIRLRKIFPNLKIISCWTDNNAKVSLDFIKKDFPNIPIQGKGLIATECIISIPINKDRPAISILSHFFEFLELNEKYEPTGKIFLTDQLKKNRRYCVVVTTSGGLYRYNLRDIIIVRDFFNNVPLVEFIGKSENVSDIRGEKLHETHVKDSILKILKKNHIEPKFVMLTPEKSKDDIFYVLFIESKSDISQNLNTELEKELCKNFHYSYCIKIGQLKNLKIFKVSSDGNIDYMYRKNACARLGNIKNSYLDKEFGWTKIFKGRII